MSNELKTPRLGAREEKAKITIYFDSETDELYRIGKANGWDTPAIVRDAVKAAIRDHAENLRRSNKKSAS